MSKRLLGLITAVVGGGFVTLILLAALGSRAAPISAAPNAERLANLITPRYVDVGTGVDAGDCSSPVAPCETIQYAVDQASNGDEIRVSGGTYSGVSTRTLPFNYGTPPVSNIITQVLFLNKAVIIRGGFTTDNNFAGPPNPEAYPTTIDAQGQGRAVVIGLTAAGDITPTIEGFNITGGDADGLLGPWGNDAGGGMLIIDATATVSNCHIYSNTADYRGAGVFLNYGSANLYYNTFSHNTGPIYGGGLYIREGSPTIHGNVFTNNSANGGGAIYMNTSSPLLTSNAIANNYAAVVGGGIDIYRSTPRFWHTTIANNNPDGIYVPSPAGVPSSDVIMTNTIVANHATGIYVYDTNTVTLQATLWYSNATDWTGGGGVYTGTFNMWADPLFAPDGYHITVGSPAIDRSLPSPVLTDVDGESRPLGLRPDVGADELRTCWARINSDPTDYTAIQGAVLAATAGDTVKVAGYCTGVFGGGVPQVVYLNKGITIQGGYTTTNWITADPTANPTILDARGDGRVFYITGNHTPTITGLHLTGGAAGAEVGGGMWTIGSHIVVSDCQIYNNSGERGGGLALASANARVINNNIYSNTGNAYAGGLYLYSSGHNALIMGNGIYSNTANNAAAAYIRDSDAPTLTGNEIFGNQGTGGIGTIHVWRCPTATLTSNQVYGNVHPGAGGGMSIDESHSSTVEDNDVYDNQATEGGGIYVVSSNGVTVHNNDVYENTGTVGGGIYVTGGSLHTISSNRVYSNTISHTSAGGGGIYVTGSPTVTVSGNQVHHNTTNQYGGGIMLNNVTAGTVATNEVYHNQATYDGGGIRLWQSSGATVENNDIYTNTARDGGGLSAVSGSDNLILTGNQIYLNYGRQGGGVHIYTSDYISLTNNTITTNTADNGGGGGIFAQQSPTMTMRGNTVSNNTSTYRGGGAHIDNVSNSQVVDNTFADNLGDNWGGGLYVEDTNGITIVDNYITGNAIDATSTPRGGGVALRLSDRIEMINNMITDNTVINTGSASGIFLSNAHARMLHTTVARNSSAGAGIAVDSTSSLVMTNTIIVSHTIGINVSGGSTATLGYTLWGTGAWANATDWINAGTLITGTLSNNWWDDPVFVDHDNGNYHLGSGSGAIDRGVYVGVDADIDGEPRPPDAVDLGADELGTQYIYLPLVLRN